jgi:hypothetical protein
MMRFIRRLAVGVAVVSALMAAVTVATPGVSSAQCDPNWSRNVWTQECKPPPPAPAWWTPPPQYAPIWAPQDIPPPPSQPPGGLPLHPVWDQAHQQWVWIGI